MSRLPLLLLATALLVYFSPISYAGSDPRLSLLVAQALLEQGTAELSAYPEAINQPDADYRLYHTADGRTYYVYPPGPSLLALPAVAVARWWGLDMANMGDDAAVQHILALFTCLVMVALLYGMARTHLPPTPSAVLAAVFMGGTVLITTLGTAYWNQNGAIMCLTAALFLLMRHKAGQEQAWYPYVVGLCLFGAYACRPTAAIAIAPLLLYLLWYQRPFFWRTAAVAGGLMMLFAAVSWHTYGLPLPPYYLPVEWGGLQGLGSTPAGERPTPPLVVIYGLLFSPSRGLLLFSPMLMVVGWHMVRHARQVWAQPLARPLLAWVALHFIVLVRFEGWWGGFTFGPRLMADMIPPLLALAVLVWPHAAPTRAGVAWGMALALPALLIHSGVGLYGHMAQEWSGGVYPPMVTPRLMLDWRMPQFLATAEGMCARSLRYHQEVVTRYHALLLSPQPSPPITPATANVNQWLNNYSWAQEPLTTAAPRPAPPAAYQGYLPVVARQGPITGLWAGWTRTGEAVCREAHLLLGPVDEPTTAETYVLAVTAHAVGVPQVVTVQVNGRPLGRLALPLESTRYELSVPHRWLNEAELNQVTFVLTLLDWPFDPQATAATHTIAVEQVQVR